MWTSQGGSDRIVKLDGKVGCGGKAGILVDRSEWIKKNMVGRVGYARNSKSKERSGIWQKTMCSGSRECRETSLGSETQNTVLGKNK